VCVVYIYNYTSAVLSYLRHFIYKFI